MNPFDRHNGELHAEDVPLSLIAEDYGTPCYVYSRAAIEQAWRAYDQAFAGHPHRVCYAVKANSNLAVLNVLARLGSGFDIVSAGELQRVLEAGGDPAKVVFSGVGKNVREMRQALEIGIQCFNVESIAELDRLAMVAEELGARAPVSLRVNPDVDAQTHPYISTGLRDNKFGIDIAVAEEVYLRAADNPNLEVIGVDFHIGSQLTSVLPFEDALLRVLHLVDQLADRGIRLRHLDIGGGMGIVYRDEKPPLPGDLAEVLLRHLQDRELEVVMEPGRAIVGNAGVLLTSVEYLKHSEHKHFCIVDAAMNDLMRPALYNAWQAIEPVRQRDGDELHYDVVGPVCETGDFLGKERGLCVEPGDLLAVMSAGAYGFVMSSNYNTRPRAAEVMVDGGHIHLVRRRETMASLWHGENLLPE